MHRVLFAFFVVGVLLGFVQEDLVPAGLAILFHVLLVLYAALHLAGEISGRRLAFAGAQFIVAAAFIAVSFRGLTLGAPAAQGEGLYDSGLLQRYFSALSSTLTEAFSEESMLPGILAAGGLAAAGALILYFLILAVSGIPVLMRCAVALADVLVVLQMIWGIPPEKAIAAGALLFTLLEIQKAVKPSSDGGWKELPADAILRWSLCLLVLEGAVFFLPSPKDPIDWSFVVRFGQRIAEGVADISRDTGYYLSGFGSGSSAQSGYRGLENAGGPDSTLNRTDREELYVTASGSVKNIYLAGAVYGGGEDVADELKGRWYFDFLSAMYSHGIDRETARLFGRRQSAGLEYGYIRTSDLIRPEKLLRIDSKVTDELSQDGVTFPEIKRKGYSYDTVFLDIDYASRYLEDILRTPAECDYPDYEVMKEYSRQLYDLQLNLTVSQMEYERWVSSKPDLTPYLDVSLYESPRLRELAQRITAGAASDYDACRAVEKYLRQYRYSVRNSASGENDFIERFLFETGEGYCVHFASSMVALLRLSGIPARYVEGYCYTFPNTQRGEFAVTGNSAHAWPEAYIEGFGWVPFEPTVIRATSLERGWGLYLPQDDPAGAPAAREEESEYTFAQDDIPAIPEAAMQGAQDPDPAAVMRQRRTDDIKRILRVLKYLALAAAAYFAAMLAAVPLIRGIRYRRKDLAGKFAADYRDILWLSDRIPSGARAGGRDPENGPGAGESRDIVPGEYLEITDPGELMDHVNGIWYRQRFAMRPASGGEVRDAGYLKSYLAVKYIGKNITSFARAVRYLLR